MFRKIKFWWACRQLKKENVLAIANMEYFRPDVMTFNITRLGYCPDIYEADEGEIIQMLKEIYSRILWKDPYWHFFYERSYLHIRCSKKFVGKVQDYLDDLGADYTNAKHWIDGSEAVQRYHAVFTYLFHGFSVLAMECEDDHFAAVMDRVVHCFMNHQWYSRDFRVARAIWGERKAEAMLIAENAVARAKYEGYCEGVTKSNKEWGAWLREKKKKEQEDAAVAQ